MNAREQFLLDRIKESIDSRKEDKEKFLLEHLKECINANQKTRRNYDKINKCGLYF